MIDALDLLNVPSNNAITFGDRVKDMKAGKNAAISTAACLWGSQEVDELMSEGADFIVRSPIDIVQVLSSRFSL